VTRLGEISPFLQFFRLVAKFFNEKVANKIGKIFGDFMKGSKNPHFYVVKNFQ